MSPTLSVYFNKCWGALGIEMSIVIGSRVGRIIADNTYQ